MKNLLKNIIYLVLFFVIMAAIFSALQPLAGEVEQVALQQLVLQIKNGQVSSIEAEETELNVTLRTGELEKVHKETGVSVVETLTNLGVTPAELLSIELTIKQPSSLSYWLGAVLPFLLPLLIIGLIIYLMARQMQGFNQRAMSFGQSPTKDSKNTQSRPNMTFKDVAGVEEAKQELQEVVEFLKLPKKFLQLGAKIPKGVLLVGPPGTGKTMLAKAVAGEARVPFFAISGSEFVEMFVGVGAARVRSLFAKAKKQSPAIIFIDEIDAVGRRRGAGLGGSHDEREQTLNQILVELDGFDTHTQVIVITATNRPDVLDPALLRPGRFDRRVAIDLPDINERTAILKIHSHGKPLANDVDLRRIAERTPGFSGADLANLINEAAILAARENKTKILQLDIIKSIEKVMLGPERQSHVLSADEKYITAFHEAGHAMVAHFLPNTDPVYKISIISRGHAGGYTIKLPETDKHLHSRTQLLEDIAVMLAGHATEKEVFNELTSGATNDLRQATALARRIVVDLGMSEKLGPRTFGERDDLIFLGREIHEQKDYSESTAKLIDGEINNIITRAYTLARGIIKKHRKTLDKIVEKLIKQETLEREEFEKLVGPKPKTGRQKIKKIGSLVSALKAIPHA